MEHTDFRHGAVVPYLREWRQSQLLSQVELAAKVGVSRDSILAAEAGRPIRISSIGKIARFFGVDRPTLVYSRPTLPIGEVSKYDEE